MKSFFELILISVLMFSVTSTPVDQEQTSGGCRTLIKKWTLWTGGLASTLKIPVTEDITSWNVEVTFNKQFAKLSFFNALSDKTTGKV